MPRIEDLTPVENEFHLTIAWEKIIAFSIVLALCALTIFILYKSFLMLKKRGVFKFLLAYARSHFQQICLAIITICIVLITLKFLIRGPHIY